MKAAIVREAGQGPVYGEFAEPEPQADERVVSVTAAAVSHLVRHRAAGRHYSSTIRYPLVVGIDGVGRLDDGRRVYFIAPRAPFGSMAERTVVPAARVIPLPDGLDDVTAAAIANPGMSSWAAFTARARLAPGDTVLLNGATGTSGRLAVQIARYLGAGKIIATGRDPDGLHALEALGVDVTIPLTAGEAELATRFHEQFAEGVDVILDFIWGRSMELLLAAASGAGTGDRPVRVVQIGTLSGSEITLPSAVLRAAAIELMGSGLGSVSYDGLLAAIDGVFRATVAEGFAIATTPVPLAGFDRAGPQFDGKRRTVFTLDPPA